jgi:CubicO group peptidase (beta-lactamase class C family)
MLLAHTSGTPAGINVTRRPDIASRRAAIVAEPLRRGARPGGRFVYSDVNLMLLGMIAEKVAGRPLDELVRVHITGPLGLRDTGFNARSRVPTADRGRLVATEHRPRGVVHDGNAHSLAASPATRPLQHGARSGRGVPDADQRRRVRRSRILRERTVRSMLTNVNRGRAGQRPGGLGRTSAHGLGVDLDQRWYMGGLASSVTFGHTGFTGTSFVVDPARRAALVLLTNRVHRSSQWGTVTPPGPRSAASGRRLPIAS